MSDEHNWETCPFCGGKITITSGRRCDDDWGRFWETSHRPACTKCGIAFGEFDKRKKAVIALTPRNEADQLKAQVAELRELLAQAQWGTKSSSSSWYCCPSCGNSKNSGHDDDCRIAKALAKTKEVADGQ